MDGNFLVASGRSLDVAAAIVGLLLSACFVVALLVIGGALWLLERLGVIKPESPESPESPVDSVPSGPAEPGTREPEPAQPPQSDPGSDAPVAEAVIGSAEPIPTLATAGAGLPTSRLDRPGWSPEATARWRGRVVASGCPVDLEQLAVLFAIIPREWLS